MASDKTEALIQEIALKHGIAVGRDDPILVLQTINERLLREAAAAQQAMLEQFRQELESIAHRWGLEAKDKAERTLNAALAASQEAMRQATREGASTAAEAIRGEVQACAAQLGAPLREARRVGLMNLAAAAMAVVAAGLALWAAR